MFGLQSFIEVYDSLKARKVRTIFTGFGVMWAMLMLVLLQGGGTGFYNGVRYKFRCDGRDVMRIYGGYTPTGGIGLNEDVADSLAYSLNGFEQVMPVFRKNYAVGYKQNLYKKNILGVRSGYEKVSMVELAEGRFFTQRDVAQKLPVCILGSAVKAEIFSTGSVIGELISIGTTVFCVIGVLESTRYADNMDVLIPDALFKALFPKQASVVDYIICALKPKQNMVKLEEKIQAYLARQLNFEVKDKAALSIRRQQGRTFQVLFIIIQGLVWFVGICFLISGVVGVGNMMLVVVKERMQELAIRKVLGARPGDIVGLILLETIVTNLIAGVLGMGIGIGAIQWINSYLMPSMAKYDVTNFQLQYTTALIALVILVLSGCLASIIPAKRALYIKPVDALNNE